MPQYIGIAQNLFYSLKIYYQLNDRKREIYIMSYVLSLSFSEFNNMNMN